MSRRLFARVHAQHEGRRGTVESVVYTGEVVMGDDGYTYLCDDGEYLAPGYPHRVERLEEPEDARNRT